MEAMEIMNNEEVVETTEEIVKAGTGKGLKIAAGVGLAVLTGVMAYKYIVKPIAAKIKAKKEEQVIALEMGTASEDDDTVSDVN